MIIGYLWCGENSPKWDNQKQALLGAGCEKIVSDDPLMNQIERPVLRQLIETLTPEDTLVVWKIDQLADKSDEIIGAVNSIDKKGTIIKSIKDAFDMSSYIGRALFSIIKKAAT